MWFSGYHSRDSFFVETFLLCVSVFEFFSLQFSLAGSSLVDFEEVFELVLASAVTALEPLVVTLVLVDIAVEHVAVLLLVLADVRVEHGRNGPRREQSEVGRGALLSRLDVQLAGSQNRT